MVNFSDPIVTNQDFLILKHLWHTISGLYIWEFFTTLDYELNIIRGRRPHRWAIWIYSLTRVTTLVTVVLDFVVLNATTPINCQAWITSEVIFGYLSLSIAQSLIVLRIVAIWNRNKLVVAIASSLWVINVAVIILGVVRLRSDWVPLLGICVVFSTEKNKPNFVVSLVTDFVLLLLVLVGLLRLHRRGSGMLGLGRLLWRQGVIWLVLATVADVPTVVFITLNLNDPLNILFQLPALIIMSIAATRMHRSLTDYVSGPADITFESLKMRKSNVLDINCDPSSPVPHNRIEVAVDTTYEMSRMSHNDWHADVDGQPDDRLHELHLDKRPGERHGESFHGVQITV